jgi:hypothetical protein
VLRVLVVLAVGLGVRCCCGLGCLVVVVVVVVVLLLLHGTQHHEGLAAPF